jgi:hypothetical protein
MARSPQTEQTGTVDQTTEGAPKRKVNRGARGPQPVYLFVKNDPNTGKLAVSKSFRDPRKMAQYFAQAAEEGSQFLVTTPE